MLIATKYEVWVTNSSLAKIDIYRVNNNFVGKCLAVKYIEPAKFNGDKYMNSSLKVCVLRETASSLKISFREEITILSLYVWRKNIENPPNSTVTTI